MIISRGRVTQRETPNSHSGRDRRPSPPALPSPTSTVEPAGGAKEGARQGPGTQKSREPQWPGWRDRRGGALDRRDAWSSGPSGGGGGGGPRVGKERSCPEEGLPHFSEKVGGREGGRRRQGRGRASPQGNLLRKGRGGGGGGGRGVVVVLLVEAWSSSVGLGPGICNPGPLLPSPSSFLLLILL